MLVYICDDQADVLNALADMIREAEPGVKIRSFGDVPSLFAALEDNAQTVGGVFLDIVFSGTERIDAANELHAMYPALPIVFMTGHLHYAPDIFDAAPVYLLAKPLQPGRVVSALEAIRERGARCARDTLTVRTQDGLRSLPWADIECFESRGRKITAYGTFGSAEFYGKLAKLEEAMPDGFARCHQSYIINMDRVSLVTPDAVVMLSGREVPIAKRRSNAFREAFVLYHAAHPGIPG